MAARLFTLHPVGLPDVQVRVIEYRIERHTAERLAQFPSSQTSNHADPGQLHRLVTTLLDPQQAPAVELILCYHERWEIEACIDEQKTHLRLSGQPLRSKEPGLVRQELYGLLLAHYTVRWWMHQSARQADLDPDRLSFTHAVEVLDTACYEFALVAREELPRLKERLLADLREPATMLPPRRLRFYPRVVKHAYSSFHRKRPDSKALPSKSRASGTFFLFKWHCPLVTSIWPKLVALSSNSLKAEESALGCYSQTADLMPYMNGQLTVLPDSSATA